MRIYNNYVITIASLLLLTTVILAAVGVNSLDVYYTCYVVEALIITELYVYFNARARRSLAVVSAVLFAGFMVILLSTTLKILA